MEEKQTLSNVFFDTDTFKFKLLIDSLQSNEEFLLRNGPLFIGSFYYLDQIKENLDNSYFAVDIRVSSSDYTYLEMVEIVESSEMLVPMVSSENIKTNYKHIVGVIRDDDIFSAQEYKSYTHQVTMITYVVGFILLMNIIFFFFQQKEEIFVRVLHGNRITTLFYEIVLKEIVYIYVTFFICTVFFALFVAFPLRTLSIDFLSTFIRPLMSI